jgi:hypothetical protein
MFHSETNKPLNDWVFWKVVDPRYGEFTAI